jgi:hypothetical protein
MLERRDVPGSRTRPQRLALVRTSLGDPLRGVGLEVGDQLRCPGLLGAVLRGRPVVSLDELALLVEPALDVDLGRERDRGEVSQEVGADVPSLVKCLVNAHFTVVGRVGLEPTTQGL